MPGEGQDELARLPFGKSKLHGSSIEQDVEAGEKVTVREENRMGY